jgi:O-antigen/teichoic acid export membrane protein
MIKRLMINTGSNYVVLLLKLVLTFLLTPIFIDNLGTYKFGIWELVVAILGYTGLLDLGLLSTIARFTAKYRAEDDQDALNKVFSSVLAFLTTIGFVLAVITLSIAFTQPDILVESENDNINEYFWFLVIIAIQIAAKFPGLVAAGTLEGYQKYYIKNILTVIDSVFIITATLLFMNKENALVLLAGVSTFGLAWKYIVYFIVLRKDHSYPLIYSRAHVSIATLKELLSFGLKSFVQGVAHRIEARSDIFVIGSILGPAIVPLYSIPSNLVAYLDNFVQTGSNAFMPLFSDLSARKQNNKITKIYILTSKLLVSILILLSIGILFLGAHFVGIWIGDQFYDDAVQLIPFLILYSIIPLLNPLASRYLTAVGRHGIYAKIAPVTAILNITLSILLAKEWGIVGVAIGSVIPVFIFFPVILTVSCNSVGISPLRYLYLVVVPTIIPGIALSTYLYFSLMDNVAVSYLSIINMALIGGAIYLSTYILISTNRKEKQLIKNYYLRIIHK